MSDEITPRAMLTMYRQRAHEFDKEQADLFIHMTAQERMELLFYMVLSANKGLQYVHSKLEPDQAEPRSLTDFKQPN